MGSSKLLFVDAVINLALGVVLLTFSERVVTTLGIPETEETFYPSILGAVLLGIGVALLVECYRRPGGMVGLGLGGAVAINLCGGLALAVWLAVGRLDIPSRGRALLWSVAVIVVGLACVELRAWMRTVRSTFEPR